MMHNYLSPGHYLKIAIRHLIKNKVYAIINIGGLALGIAAFLLILQFVSLEKSVNQFHANLPNMYRMLCQNTEGNNWPQVEPGWADKIKTQMPEVKAYCRVADGIGQGIVQNPITDLALLEQKVAYVEGNFFQFFSFPLVQGKAAELNQPDVCFVSEDIAKKYFAQGIDPIGKSLTINNQFGTHLYIVKGIFKNIGDESDIRQDIVLSLETLKNKNNLGGNGWADLDNLDNQYLMMYLELQEGTDYRALEKKLTTLRRELQIEKDDISFRLQPLADVYLGGKSDDALQHSGNRKYVYILSGIAFMILLIAWFNYVNLSTANTLKRANEVGVRKVVGATRYDLLGLFMTESMLVNLLAFGGGIFLMYLLQAPFNELIGKNLQFSSLFLNPVWIYGLALLVLGSIASGIYTALSLSQFQPIQTLKGKISKTAGGALLRKSLVVMQFSISVTLIISTILVYHQLRYMQQKNLGVKLNQMLFVSAPKVGIDKTINDRTSAYYNEVAALNYVQDYCTSNSVPGQGFNFSTGGFTSPKSKPGDENKSYAFAIVGSKYLPVYEIPLIAGRNFTEAETEIDWNNNDKIILNEKAVKNLGYENVTDILNDKIKWDERYLQVIGIIKDYHHEGLQQVIKPMMLYPSRGMDLSIKLTTDNIQNKVAAIEKIYKKYFPGNPFIYFFMDEWFNTQYAGENQFRRLFTAASLLAIFIACLGLFGLSIYTVESRTKEIGIRKVLGASVQGITSLISKDFIKLVFIGIIIASPIAYYFMNKWLADFAYKIDIEWWVFALAGMIAIGIALFTISFQSIKAAVANPVKSLRTE